MRGPRLLHPSPSPACRPQAPVNFPRILPGHGGPTCHLSHEMAAESHKTDPPHDQEGGDAGLAVGSAYRVETSSAFPPPPWLDSL